jgi:hypothetical protein
LPRIHYRAARFAEHFGEGRIISLACASVGMSGRVPAGLGPAVDRYGEADGSAGRLRGRLLGLLDADQLLISLGIAEEVSGRGGTLSVWTSESVVAEEIASVQWSGMSLDRSTIPT